MKAGIATIYQELDLVDDLSVAENVFLGHEPRRFGFVRRGYMTRRTREILGRLGHGEIPPRRLGPSRCRRPASRWSAWPGRCRTRPG